MKKLQQLFEESPEDFKYYNNVRNEREFAFDELIKSYETKINIKNNSGTIHLLMEASGFKFEILVKPQSFEQLLMNNIKLISHALMVRILEDKFKLR